MYHLSSDPEDEPFLIHLFQSQLKDADPNMFFRLCMDNMSEFTPLIYTPTVGDACLQYSHIYRRPEGLVSLNLLVSCLS